MSRKQLAHSNYMKIDHQRVKPLTCLWLWEPKALNV